MSFGDDIGKEFEEKALKRVEHTVKSASLNLQGDLVEASPVDTGELRISWQMPERLDRFKWKIANIAPHAEIIDGGRRMVTVDGKQKEIGSHQLPYGFRPIIDETEQALQKEFKK